MSAVYEGPSGLACATVVLPATIALFKGMRILGRGWLESFLRARGIDPSADKLDKGIGCAPIAHAPATRAPLTRHSYVISALHALANAGFSTYKLMQGDALYTLRTSTWLSRYHAAGTVGY